MTSTNGAWSAIFIDLRIANTYRFGYRIGLAPPFPGLRRFPEGRGFKQWTGDDSKALMKVRFCCCKFSPVLISFALQSGLR